MNALQMAPDDVAGRAIKAACAYFCMREEPSGLDLPEQMLFAFIRDDIDKGLQRFADTCDRNRRNRGVDHSSPSVDHSSPVVTNGMEPSGVELKGAELTRNGVERRATGKSALHHFEPPSLEAVAAYCDERGNKVDPQRFVDFYASKGWKVGNQSMRDWKAAVRNWERREDTDGRTGASPGKSAATKHSRFAGIGKTV